MNSRDSKVLGSVLQYAIGEKKDKRGNKASTAHVNAIFFKQLKKLLRKFSCQHRIFFLLIKT